MVGFWIIFLIVFALVIWNAISKSQEKEAAKGRYASSLEQLKKQPQIPELRQATLALGRIYSNLLRDKKGNTVFDEVALMNDINAACAGAHTSASMAIATAVPSMEGRIRQLQELLDKQLIDDSEYATRKQEILRQI
jgi:hypothetical protein